MNESIEEFVFVDTNIIRNEDNTDIIKPSFKSFFLEYAKEFNLKLMIPEVVKGEIKYHHVTNVVDKINEVNEKLYRLKEITGKSYKHRITERRLRNDVEKKFERLRKDYKAQIVPTPIENIDWKAIIKKSIWRIGPFEESEKKEKGFRDAMILETIVDFCDNLSPNQSVSFLCNDKLLAETAERSILQDHFSVYESKADYKSTLDLKKEKLELLFIKKITSRASNKFFNQRDSNSLFNRDDIDGALRDLYGDYFNDPDKLDKGQSPRSYSIKENWEPIGLGSYGFPKPTFDRVENGNKYFWKTEIHFVTYYRPKKSAKIAEVIEPKNAYEVKYYHNLRFSVGWWSILSKDGKFLEYKWSHIKMLETSFNTFATFE